MESGGRAGAAGALGGRPDDGHGSSDQGARVLPAERRWPRAVCGETDRPPVRGGRDPAVRFERGRSQTVAARSGRVPETHGGDVRGAGATRRGDGQSTSEPGLDRGPPPARRSREALATEDDPDQVLRIVLHEAIDLSAAQRGFVVTVRARSSVRSRQDMDWSEVAQPTIEVSRTSSGGSSPRLIDPSQLQRGGCRLRDEQPRRDRRPLDACVPLVHEGSPWGPLSRRTRSLALVRQRDEAVLRPVRIAGGAALKNAQEHRARAAPSRRRRDHPPPSNGERKRVRFEG
jgi:hypothetical protein